MAAQTKLNKAVQEEAKDIILKALLGDQDANESIETLSSLLFPEDNLIQVVESMKITRELNQVFENLKSKGNYKSCDIISDQKTNYTIDIQFDDTKDFSMIQHDIVRIANHVSQKHHINIHLKIAIEQRFQTGKSTSSLTFPNAGPASEPAKNSEKRA